MSTRVLCAACLLLQLCAPIFEFSFPALLAGGSSGQSRQWGSVLGFKLLLAAFILAVHTSTSGSDQDQVWRYILKIHRHAAISRIPGRDAQVSLAYVLM